MADWTALPRDILVLIAKRTEFFEDFCKFYAVCKSWHSVTSILGKFPTLPTRFPWLMLIDKAERNFPKVTEDTNTGKMLIGEVRKNQQIEGMLNRQFFSFSTLKSYEFELPEATLKKCLGVGYGLLLALDYDLQINILNPFTRQQIGMPNMLSFNDQFDDYEFFQLFVRKAAMSSNPYKPSNQDCIMMTIYGRLKVLAFARPGDKVWTDISRSLHCGTLYQDVVYYNENFYAVDSKGIIVVCDINESKSTPIACIPDYIYHGVYNKYLVELSGDLLLIIRFRKSRYNEDDKVDIRRPYNHTVGFSIFKMEKSDGDSSHNYPYKLTEVKNLGNNALFLGNNASVSVPSSRRVRANSIYFSDDEVVKYFFQPYGGGYDTGLYDVGNGKISLHYASKFMSLITPPMWIIT